MSKLGQQGLQMPQRPQSAKILQNYRSTNDRVRFQLKKRYKLHLTKAKR